MQSCPAVSPRCGAGWQSAHRQSPTTAQHTGPSYRLSIMESTPNSGETVCASNSSRIVIQIERIRCPLRSGLLSAANCAEAHFSLSLQRPGADQSNDHITLSRHRTKNIWHRSSNIRVEARSHRSTHRRNSCIHIDGKQSLRADELGRD